MTIAAVMYMQCGIALIPFPCTTAENCWAKTIHYESYIVSCLCIIPKENPTLGPGSCLTDTPLFTGNISIGRERC